MASTCGAYTTSIRGICGSGAIPHDPFDPVQPGKRRTNGSTCHERPGLKPGDMVSTAHGFLVFIGGDGARRRPDDFQRIPQTQRNDFDRRSAKNLPIGRIVGEDPWSCSSTRAQAAILKWNCGICNFGPRNFSLLIKLPSTVHTINARIPGKYCVKATAIAGSSEISEQTQGLSGS